MLNQDNLEIHPETVIEDQVEESERTYCPTELTKMDLDPPPGGRTPRSAKTSPGHKRVRNRYDSVYRSLLRRFRKYYNISFDDLTRYKALKRYRKEEFFME